MTKNPQFLTTRTSWKAVAKEVSRLAGKPYDAQYIREVATGYRRNRQLIPILTDLGVLQVKAA